jgi:CBS domain-containing protein
MQASLATVKDFMTKHVETVSHNVTVGEALRKMVERDVGSLVVMSGMDPIGVLSERDLVSRLMAKGKIPENTNVTDVMSGEIVRFGPDESLREAASMMNSKRNRLLVFDEDRMIGIVTATDIVRALHELPLSFDIDRAVMKSVYTLKAESTLQQAVEVMTQLRIGSLIITADDEPDGMFTEWDLVRNVLVPHLDFNQPVGGQASRPLITAEEGVDGKEAADIMTINGIKRLPLTRDGAIVGIITARDLVEAFANS